MPKRLRRKADALTYERLATVSAQLACEDARYADLAQYYRDEFEKRRLWLE